MGKYYNNCPTVSKLSGFINYVNVVVFKNQDGSPQPPKTFLKVNADISQSYEGKRSNKGERQEYSIEIPKDHEAMAVIDDLIAQGKIDGSGKVDQGVRGYFVDAGLQIAFKPWVNKNGETVAQFSTRLAPWGKFSLTPPQRGEVNTEAAAELAAGADDIDF